MFNNDAKSIDAPHGSECFRCHVYDFFYLFFSSFFFGIFAVVNIYTFRRSILVRFSLSDCERRRKIEIQYIRIDDKRIQCIENVVTKCFGNTFTSLQYWIAHIVDCEQKKSQNNNKHSVAGKKYTHRYIFFLCTRRTTMGTQIFQSGRGKMWKEIIAMPVVIRTYTVHDVGCNKRKRNKDVKMSLRAASNYLSAVK